MSSRLRSHHGLVQSSWYGSVMGRIAFVLITDKVERADQGQTHSPSPTSMICLTSSASQYFSTLDLAAGFWQIRMHPDAREKIAFVTSQGLYEFRAMPFSLTNAPAVFQRLIQQVLMGLNPECGPEFVSVYIDDILMFS